MGWTSRLSWRLSSTNCARRWSRRRGCGQRRSRSNHTQSGTAPDHCDRDDNNAREQVISAAELDGLLGAGPQPGSIEARLLLLPPSRSSTPAAK